MQSNLSDTDQPRVLTFKKPGAPLDISNPTTGSIFTDHIAWLKQWGALVFDAGKSTGWLENKMVNAGLFDFAVQITETSARCLRIEGRAITSKREVAFTRVVATVECPKT